MRFRLEEAPSSNDLGEETQVSDIQFALCSLEDESVRPTTPYVFCRDFLCDAITSITFGRDIEDIYGFKYDHKELLRGPVTAIAIKTETIARIDRNLPILHELEKGANLLKSQIFSTTRENEYLILADKKWSMSPVHMSLLTLLIRMSTYAAGNNTLEELLASAGEGEGNILKTVDAEFIRLYMRNFESMTSKWKEKFESRDLAFSFGMYESHIHTGTGVVALAEGVYDKVNIGDMYFLGAAAEVLIKEGEREHVG